MASSADDIIKRLGDGRYQGLADILKETPDSVVDIASNSTEGKALAQKLNIQTPEGDGWYARVNTNGYFVVSYYSAADNKGVTFDQLQSDYNNTPDNNKSDKYGKDSTGRYKIRIKIDEGYYYPNGTSEFYPGTAGHIEVGSNGSMSIYPGNK